MLHGETRVLAGVDLVTRRGRTTALIGPSGSGKSTILRLMLGLWGPDRGRVLFDGAPVERSGPAALALRRRVGYVIQEGGLFPHLTARDNVTLVARWRGDDDDAIERRLLELAALARLPVELLGRFPAELSGGQRQRVGLMRALMLDPDALLLDEPLGALDPLIRAELQLDLRDIFRSLAKTVVLVTHDLAEAAYFAEHIVLLRGGAIVQQGALADFIARPRSDFVARFVSAQRTVALSPPRAPEAP
ncbi:MAG: ATP-binding cassette domain-containing protein [Myxococcales bacterium]|nr:ATP-binding cassette domain-containing protein [Myxococcales bacterium]